MRALAMLQAMAPSMLQAMAEQYAAEGSDARTIAMAMRSTRAVTTVLEACPSQRLQRDLVRICALPLETIAEDAVSVPMTFVELGLLWPVRDGYAVQEDLAVALVPNLPGERGSLLTLLARLSSEATMALGRTLGVGPRPTHAEWVFDAAAILRDPSEVAARVARLRSVDRELVARALEAEPMTAAVPKNPAEADLPVVTLAEGAAGELGLLFRVAKGLRDGAAQLVVPLELVAPIGAALERMPIAVKEPVRRPARNASSSPRRAKAEVAPEPLASPARWVLEEPAVSAPPAVLRRSKRVEEEPARSARPQPVRRAPNGASRPDGWVTVRPASAWVQVGSREEVLAVRRDLVLGPAVLESTADGVVVLRSGVDVAAWLESYVIRMRERSALVGAKRETRWDV